MTNVASRSVVFSTPWFNLVAKDLEGGTPGQPHYCLTTTDYVSVIALTPAMEMVLVRQYRPAVELHTLELPSGHVDAGETPEASAARELWEETGYRAPRMELLGPLRPDTGRMANRIWFYLAFDVRLDPAWKGPEPGVEPLLRPAAALMEDIRKLDFDHCLHLAPILLALLKSERFAGAVNLASRDKKGNIG